MNVYGLSEVVGKPLLFQKLKHFHSNTGDYTVAELGDGSQLVIGSQHVRSQMYFLRTPVTVTIRHDGTTYYLERIKRDHRRRS